MSRKYKKLSASFKAKVVLEVLKEERTLNQIASEHNVTPKNLQNWKKQFLSNAEIAMDPAKAVQEYKERLKANQNEIEQLQKTLGKTVLEYRQEIPKRDGVKSRISW